MARKGVLKKIQLPDQAVTRAFDDVRDALDKVAGDHDVVSSPLQPLLVTGAIPAGYSFVAFDGNASQTLSLPPANALGTTSAQAIFLMNRSQVPVTVAPTRGDTLNGGNSVAIPAGVPVIFLCDGDTKWMTAGFSGRLLRAPQVLTSGTSITHPAGTAMIRIRGVAGGGGGGGVAAAGAGQTAIASGGGSGGYVEKTFVASSLTSTYAVGAAGAAGASGGGAGGAGGNSTFTHGAVTVTANGGAGGSFLAPSAVVKWLSGAFPPAVSTNGDLNGTGAAGGMALQPDAGTPTFAFSGAGGSSPFGGGPAGRSTSGAGVAATSRGSGGGGGLSLDGAGAAAGGAGSAGVWIVEEYS